MANTPGLNVRINDKKVKRMLAKSPAWVKAEIDDILDESADRSSREIRIQAPKAVTGLLKQTQVVRRPDRRTVFSKANYAKYVEFGTRPHWTSIDNLREWARQKGLNPRAVQIGIARRGTKANPFTKTAYDKVRPDIERISKKRVKALTRKMNSGKA